MGMDSSKKSNPVPTENSAKGADDGVPSDPSAPETPVSAPPPPIEVVPPPSPSTSLFEECPLGIPIKNTIPPPAVAPATTRRMVVTSGGAVTWIEESAPSAEEKARLEEEAKERALREAKEKEEILKSFVPVEVSIPDTNIVSTTPTNEYIGKLNEQAAELKKIEDKKKAQEKERLEKLAKSTTYYGYGGYGNYGYNANRDYYDGYSSPPVTRRYPPPRHYSDDDESPDDKPTPEEVLRGMNKTVETLRTTLLRMNTTLISMHAENKTLKAEVDTLKILVGQMNIKLNVIKAAVVPSTGEQLTSLRPADTKHTLSAEAIRRQIAEA